MTKLPVKHLVLGLLAMALFTGLPQAWGQRSAGPQPPSSERAQDQPFPPGSPFALLPGFTIERVTPETNTESLIVVTFDALGRPVVSQSSSGTGVSPRILLDNDGDGIFESEKIVSDKLNTCHGLFYESRTVLYANCRGEVPGDPPPAAAGAGGGGRGNQPPPAGIPGLYRLEDTSGDDVMDTIQRIGRYSGNGMGRSRSARRAAGSGRDDHVPGRQQHVGW